MKEYANDLLNYPYTVRVQASHKKGEADNRRFYCEDIFTFEIETTSFFYESDKKPFLYQKGLDPEYWAGVYAGALPYMWQFGVNGTYFYGRDIKDFYNNKCLSEIKDSTLFIYEKDNMNDILTNYNDLPFVGITLKVNNEVIGYTIGEIVNETLMVHVEKADKYYEGSFPTIQKLFSCYCLNKYPYLKIVNREDDAGVEGLRKAKLSYHPEILLEKYYAEFRD